MSLELEKGKSLLVKLVSIPPPNEDGIRQVIASLFTRGCVPLHTWLRPSSHVSASLFTRNHGIRQVIMELNGERWFVSITDEKAGAAVRKREKAGAPGTVGATMPGVIVDIKVKQGDFVKEGDQLAVRLIASDCQRFRLGRRSARGARAPC